MRDISGWLMTVNQGHSTDVRIFLELGNGRRIRVAQVGTDSLIVRDDEGESLAGQVAKLIIIVDGEVDEYDLILSGYDRQSRVVQFA